MYVHSWNVYADPAYTSKSWSTAAPWPKCEGMSPHPHVANPVTVRVFSQRLSATPRGARLARRFAVQQLDAWGVPYDSPASDTAALIVAELATNAVTHGRVPGRDFGLDLSLTADGTLCIEVTDTRADRRPRVDPAVPAAEAESGRGLFLVDALATRWGVTARRGGGPGKVVRAELDL